jgi:Family of unknown function (DUF6932)
MAICRRGFIRPRWPRSRPGSGGNPNSGRCKWNRCDGWLTWRSGVRRIVVNGSFVTDKLEPNDVDCVLLIGPDFPHDTAAEAELLAGLPFINMELVDPRAFQQFTERTFATDRNFVPKGMVEIVP